MRQRRKRRFFTAVESAEIWDRWRKGEGLKSIGRVFGKNSSSIFAHICPTGGIQPPPRRRSRLALTLAEREEISRGLAHGHSLRRIACSLGRAPSTVSREIARNGGSGPYRAAASDIGVGLGVRRRVSSRGTHPCGESWPRILDATGRRSRSPGG
jgi:transposase, IS30 family